MRTAAVVAAGALLLGAAAPAAAAADYQSGLWWYTEAGVAAAHAEVTGEGVTIALMDTPVNADAPALQGADVVGAGSTECASGEPVPVLSDGAGAQHGTDVATMLAGNGQPVNGNPGITGVAPGVDVLVYTAVHGQGDDVPTCVSDDEYRVGNIRDAVARGADIILFTSAQVAVGQFATALIQAVNAGVIVVASNRNAGSETNELGDNSTTASFNGVVSVESFGPGGVRDDPVVGPWLTVVSPGDGSLTYQRGNEGTWDEPLLMNGTSLATPFTAGALALAMQKWPEATSNQILQSLVHTASHANPDPVHTDEEGYGFIDLPRLLATDPTQFPNENPLIRAEGEPTLEEYEAGVYSGEFTEYPIDPPIGGTAEGDGAGDDAGAGPAGESFPVGLVLGLIGGGVVLIGVIVVVVVLAARRKPRQPAPGPYPPQGHYGQAPRGQHGHPPQHYQGLPYAPPAPRPGAAPDHGPGRRDGGARG